MTLPDLAQIAVGGGTAGFSFGLLFVAVRWSANFVAGRLDKKEARLDAETEHHFARLTVEVERLSGECNSLRTRVSATEEELDHCRVQHAECRREVMELKGLIQGRGDARNDAARIVAADRVADKRKAKE